MSSSSSSSPLPPSPPPPGAQRSIRIAVCSYAANAGSTSRAVEIAKALRSTVTDRGGMFTSGSGPPPSREECSKDGEERASCGGSTKEASSNDGSPLLNVDLRFFSHQSPPDSTSYAHLITDAKFEFDAFDFEVDDAFWRALISSERTGRGHFPPPYDTRAAKHVSAIMDKFREYRPTLVVRGLFPEAAIAASLLGITCVGFGPLPMDMGWMKRHLVMDPGRGSSSGGGGGRGGKTTAPPSVPAAVPTTDPKQSAEPKPRSPLYRAAIDCGWEPTDPRRSDESELYDLTRPDLCLVCDLESNLPDQDFGPGMEVQITGPVFATTTAAEGAAAVVPAEVAAVLDSSCGGGGDKVFLSMASSGEKDVFLEAVKAICRGGGDATSTFQAVIAAPGTVCTRPEMELAVGGGLPDGVVATECFLPSATIASRVDVFVGHGGQGTVQTALAKGTPIVGLPLQSEQRFNLRNVVARGAGILLERNGWTEDGVRRALREVLDTPSYQEAASRVRDEMLGMGDGARNAADAILDFLSVLPTTA